MSTPTAKTDDMNTATREIPEFAQAWVDRMLGNRRAGEARLVNSPDGGTVVRISWERTRFHGRGGTVTEREILWLAWRGNAWQGSYNRRKDAIEAASA